MQVLIPQTESPTGKPTSIFVGVDVAKSELVVAQHDPMQAKQAGTTIVNVKASIA